MDRDATGFDATAIGHVPPPCLRPHDLALLRGHHLHVLCHPYLLEALLAAAQPAAEFEAFCQAFCLGGGNINDVQARTFARIQLFKANEYFPGTMERTLLVTGRLKQVAAALGLVFSKLLSKAVATVEQWLVGSA
ncbi:hypothetical protein CHLNCDRAFT_139385 [Chlorella variabilis]|uniref:K Homology domain-containing protein n=1 Tax=Chlorella variabilis TaxID=554065 RepID=E1ZQ57_CHLVA|nr:hypothetical protein CHLNCDRAFT_139385 [Chlorella variabilis]EFN52097.1 hypothetical protein CHLNCDRAFT_139385 [Chlorella variabilis]|eukprot:XP_005844199.1 hypothetical protein CHLNCDRAFT_139385 [Chlorella variabilis]